MMKSLFSYFTSCGIIVQAEIAKEFTAAVLKQILDSISDQASSDQLKPWLADDFLPFVIRVLPEGLVSICAALTSCRLTLQYLSYVGLCYKYMNFKFLNGLDFPDIITYFVCIIYTSQLMFFFLTISIWMMSFLSVVIFFHGHENVMVLKKVSWYLH